MINVFSTSKYIHRRYDLKGSKIGRRVLTGKRDREILDKGDLALKDLDFEKRKEKIYIGDKNDILLKQIKKDAYFLCKIKANDYSLLLGIHYINKEKQNNQIFNSKNFINNKSIQDESILKASSLSDKSCDSRLEKLKALCDFEDGGIISESKNEIYFVGIIDILTKYNFKKKCEHFAKMVRYCSNNMICTPPQMYRDRFVNYMNQIIQKNPSITISNSSFVRLKIIDNCNGSTNNTSNNILIQNNTNNFYNIINSNNNISNLKTQNSEDKFINKKNLKEIAKKERYSLNQKYKTKEIIKEESELEKASAISSKRNNENDIKDKNSS